jgi:hypothetical protein
MYTGEGIMETLFTIVGGGFVAYVVLVVVTACVKDVRVLRNRVTVWRGIEYRNGDKRRSNRH